MSKTELGARVATLRQQKGWTQSELGAHISAANPKIDKVGQSTIQAIESGQSKRPTILYELATTLGTTVEYLSTGKAIDPKPVNPRNPRNLAQAIIGIMGDIWAIDEDDRDRLILELTKSADLSDVDKLAAIRLVRYAD
jgi:transcriptional regulator with XRE-family HTH domain